MINAAGCRQIPHLNVARHLRILELLGSQLRLFQIAFEEKHFWSIVIVSGDASANTDRDTAPRTSNKLAPKLASDEADASAVIQVPQGGRDGELLR